ncbi:MAG: hypothetical protein K0U20_08750 [Proteobacteria bacterium]|nr:hypothetical protein [Pseudomonadota bacterium]
MFNYNDGGRRDAGFKGDTGDCGVRAIAIATGIPYREVYDRMAEHCKNERPSKRRRGKSHPRTGIHNHTFKSFMGTLDGWEWVATMGIGTGCTVHAKADELPAGRLVLNVSKHYTAMIDGVINDTYDCSRDGTRCVYGYWKLI